MQDRARVRQGEAASVAARGRGRSRWEQHARMVAIVQKAGVGHPRAFGRIVGLPFLAACPRCAQRAVAFGAEPGCVAAGVPALVWPIDVVAALALGHLGRHRGRRRWRWGPNDLDQIARRCGTGQPWPNRDRKSLKKAAPAGGHCESDHLVGGPVQGDEVAHQETVDVAVDVNDVIAGAGGLRELHDCPCRALPRVERR